MVLDRKMSSGLVGVAVGFGGVGEGVGARAVGGDFGLSWLGAAFGPSLSAFAGAGRVPARGSLDAGSLDTGALDTGSFGTGPPRAGVGSVSGVAA
jgi:hypothetical protein